MFRTRQVAAAVTASLPVAGALFALLFSATNSLAQSTSAACEEAAQIAVLPAPIAPWKGAPLRVIVASEKAPDGELSLIAPDGSVAAKSRNHHDGPPYFWFAEVASPAPGMRRPGAAGALVRRKIFKKNLNIRTTNRRESASQA